jgi:hypothetical protein
MSDAEGSEGSEGLAAITMTQHAPINKNLPMSMKRARNKAVYDSEDEEREEEGRDDAMEKKITPRKRKGSKEGRRPTRSKNVESGISIRLGTEEGDETEGDDGEEQEEQESSRRRSLRGRAKKGKRAEPSEEDDEIVEIASPPRRRSSRKTGLQANDSIIIDEDSVPTKSMESIPVPSPSPIPMDEVIEAPPPARTPSPTVMKPTRATRSTRFRPPAPLKQTTSDQLGSEALRRSGRNGQAAAPAPARFIPPARVTRTAAKNDTAEQSGSKRAGKVI